MRGLFVDAAEISPQQDYTAAFMANSYLPSTCLRLVLAAFLCVVATLVIADVYRWKDAEGNVHFSDQPHEGAEIIQLKQTTIVPSQRPATRLSPETAAEPGSVALDYSGIEIASPTDKETLRNTQQVSVSISIEPSLQTDFGHRVLLLLDGAGAAEPSTQTAFTLEGVARGAHTLVATIIGDDNRELARSAQSTFYLHRQSVPKPKKPAGPAGRSSPAP